MSGLFEKEEGRKESVWVIYYILWHLVITKLYRDGYCFPQFSSYPAKLDNLLKVKKENLGLLTPRLL